jgi:MoaA/NifB/PqqE/SkfB family radical SAM enzyme
MFHWHSETKPIKIGNINDKSLKEIWQDSEFRKFREAHRTQKLDDYPVCQSCDGWAAYTDVWKREAGRFSYEKVKLRDFLRRAPEHRGG